MKPNTIVMVAVIFFLSACCKHKQDDLCKQENHSTLPFVEKFNYVMCDDSSERLYVLTRKSQIDSLEPHCVIPFPIAYPVDETDMAYIIFGKMSYYRRDTFETALYKDTCNKKLTYDVKMIQRTDSSLGSFAWPLYMFCSVENIPADYTVEVKYKYVPIQ